MTERTSKRGRIRADWSRKEIGRIRVAWGFTQKEHNEFISALDVMYDNAMLDELRAVERGDLTPAQVVEAARKGRLLRLDLLLDVKTRLPLWATLNAMVAKRANEEDHQSYTKALRILRSKSTLADDALIEDLLTIDRAALRRSYNSPVTWNHMRASVLVGLTQLFGSPDHEFRLRVRKVFGKREKEPKRPLSVTPALFWQLVDLLPEHVRAPIVTIVATGMRLGEYVGCKDSNLRPNYCVYAPGTKNADAEGLVHVAQPLWPWIVQGIPSPLSRKSIRKNFQAAAIKVGLGRREHMTRGGHTGLQYTGLRIHDLRHLAAIFALEGGASINEVQSLLRHADPKQTMWYATLGDNQRAAEAVGRALEREVPHLSTQRADA